MSEPGDTTICQNASNSLHLSRREGISFANLNTFVPRLPFDRRPIYERGRKAMADHVRGYVLPRPNRESFGAISRGGLILAPLQGRFVVRFGRAAWRREKALSAAPRCARMIRSRVLRPMYLSDIRKPLPHPFPFQICPDRPYPF